MNKGLTNERTPEEVYAWMPTPEFIDSANMMWLMREVGVDSCMALHEWSVQHRDEFWALVIQRLGIQFQKSPDWILDLSQGVENPAWLPGAQFNIVDSCFQAPADSPAIIHQAEGGELKTTTVGELAAMTGQVAANLQRLEFQPGDRLALIMPMTMEAVAIFLGIIKAGCCVVGIADSFQPRELTSRLQLACAKAVFTQDVILRAGKVLPLYAQMVEADAPRAIVLPERNQIEVTLRSGDISWQDFLQPNPAPATVVQKANDCINVLFSSGTTGEPKVIPWTHSTPIKCAMDAHFHQNVRAGDVLVWPTNMGWMMGPWLVFASLLNRATIGLYYGTPAAGEFGRFVERSKTTMLGVIPSLVKSWRGSECMQNMDWKSIKVLSSTGECSNADDMRWLMESAGGKPVIEYCGGTEIGGAYITGSVMQPCFPGTFSMPALGVDFVILDASGKPANEGELFIIPPSMGLSDKLLNQDHHRIYFADTPKLNGLQMLRRHGDQMQRLANGYLCCRGRTDDTMNLGGIKVGAVEIEDVLRSVPGVDEVAAIGVAPYDGPSLLVIYAASEDASEANRLRLLGLMQKAIKDELNPLFKIHEVVLTKMLPRTASNKIARRMVREQWLAGFANHITPGIHSMGTATAAGECVLPG